mgnify:FL=1
MYGFLQYTDKSIGVKFRKWIRREVIPEIRKTGSYSLVKDDFKVVWESNGSWSGAVNKYNLNVVNKIRLWFKGNNNPKMIEGKNKKYYVFYER